MPTKRTRINRYRAPTGFEGIRLIERIHWDTSGPLIAGGVFDNRGRAVPAGLTESGYNVWPTWSAWAAFYATVRSEYLAWLRGPDTPTCERIYQAIQRGADPAEERRAIAAEQAANDPRTALAAIVERG